VTSGNQELWAQKGDQLQAGFHVASGCQNIDRSFDSSNSLTVNMIYHLVIL